MFVPGMACIANGGSTLFTCLFGGSPTKHGQPPDMVGFFCCEEARRPSLILVT